MCIRDSINSVPTSAKDAYTCIRLGNGGNVYDFGVGSNDSYQKVIYDNGETLALDDTALIRLEKKDGKITLYRAASLFEWTKVSEYTACLLYTSTYEFIKTAAVQLLFL